MNISRDNSLLTFDVFGRRVFLFLLAMIPVVFTTGCGIVKEKFTSSFKNPKSGVPAIDTTATDEVETSATETGVRGKVRGLSSRTQYINGASGTSLNDAKVLFPPGSLPIDADISVEPGLELSGDAELAERGLDGFAKHKSASVLVFTAGSIDALIPFVVALPHPATSAQLMEATGTLLVIYDTTRASDGKRFRQYFKREQLKVNDADIRITSKYFGTFQAIYYEPSSARPPAVAKNVLFQPGMTLLSFGGNQARVNGFTGWGAVLNPFRVEAGAILSTGLITRAILP